MAVDRDARPSMTVPSLCPCFKLTEVFLRDNDYDKGFVEDWCRSPSAQPVEDIALSFEDLELCKEMVALGLPTVFRNNNERDLKGRRNRKRAQRSTYEKHDSSVSGDGIMQTPTRNDETVAGLPDLCHTDAENHVGNTCCINRDSEVVPLEDGSSSSESVGFPAVVRDSEIYEAPKVEILNGKSPPEISLDRLIMDPTINFSAFANVGGPEYCIEDPLPGICGMYADEKERKLDRYDSLENSCSTNGNVESYGIGVKGEEHQCFSLHESFHASNGHQFESSELIVPGSTACWKAVWDDFYGRNYFYNVVTLETTWHPPYGMDHLVFTDGAGKLSNLVADTNDATGGETDLVNASHGPNVMDVCKVCETGDFLSDETCRISESVGSAALDHCHYEVTYGMEDNANLLMVAPVDSCQHMEELKGLTPKQDCKKADGKSLCSTPCGMSLIVDDRICSSEAVPINVGSEDRCGSDIIKQKFVKLVNDAPNPHLLPCNVKMKKKARDRLPKKLSDWERTEVTLPGMMEGWPANIMKYWCQRYSLFSRFDEGIRLDEEGWFSVTPEPLARHHASRCRCGTIIDCFTGVGGNAIQFAKKSKHVIAIDIDPQKIDYALNNAHVYGVANKIDFIKADFFSVAPSLKADVVFLSPPWGGPDYSKVETYNIKTMLKPHDGYFLFSVVRTISSRIVMFLPRNVDLNQLAELSALADPCTLEVEKAYINGKLKGITAYFEIS